MQASRIDFSLPVTNTTARRGHARERRKTSQACRGNCGDFVDTLVGAIRLACCDDFALARYTRSGGLDPTFREAWKGPERLRFPLADESRYSPPDGEAVERARDLADGAMAQSAATGRAHNGPRDATSVARSVGRLEPLCRRAGTLTNGGGFGGLKRSAGLKRVGGFYFVSNTGSNTLSSLRIDDGGQPALANAVAANTHPGPDRSSFERPFPLRPDWAHEHGGRVPRRL